MTAAAAENWSRGAIGVLLINGEGADRKVGLGSKEGIRYFFT